MGAHLRGVVWFGGLSLVMIIEAEKLKVARDVCRNCFVDLPRI